MEDRYIDEARRKTDKVLEWGFVSNQTVYTYEKLAKARFNEICNKIQNR